MYFHASPIKGIELLLPCISKDGIPAFFKREIPVCQVKKGHR